MAQREKVIFSWSGGKDSALALHELLRGGAWDVVGLLTTVAQQYQRVSHHGVREELLDMQARALGLPLYKAYIPADRPCTNELFEEIWTDALAPFRDAGVVWVGHGDIFLQDLRDYRERLLASIGMKGLFPLWQRDTGELLRSFVQLGFKAYLCCVDGKTLGEPFAGRALDEALARDFPAGVDPCGENGEYHSFVYDGPVFARAVPVAVGEIVMRDSRFYADLVPDSGQADKRMMSRADIPPIC